MLANPASVNCIEKGNTLEIRKDASGGEVGYCIFKTGGECEEWAFFRGECDASRTVPALNGTGSAPKFSKCPYERSEMCTMEYSPVCGRAGTTPSSYGYQTYPSACVACSKSSPALEYARGTCESMNLTQQGKKKGVLYDCPYPRFTSCTNESDAVCGRLVDPSSSISNFADFANPCLACSKESNAIAYYIGTCAER